MPACETQPPTALLPRRASTLGSSPPPQGPFPLPLQTPRQPLTSPPTPARPLAGLQDAKGKRLQILPAPVSEPAGCEDGAVVRGQVRKKSVSLLVGEGCA